jgi:PilZ domain
MEGTWSGAAGTNPCRIGDLSLGGCFVYSMAQPLVGSATTVTIAVEEVLPISLAGRVVSIEAHIGFGVQFLGLSAAELDRLTEILDLLRARA